jgi:hypothetical protein
MSDTMAHDQRRSADAAERTADNTDRPPVFPHTPEQSTEISLTSHGQRRINLIWEITQGVIALVLVGTACYSLLREISLPAEYWLLLGIVVNSYFQRTNHTKIGGVGPDSEGR